MEGGIKLLGQMYVPTSPIFPTFVSCDFWSWNKLYQEFMETNRADTKNNLDILMDEIFATIKTSIADLDWKDELEASPKYKEYKSRQMKTSRIKQEIKYQMETVNTRYQDLLNNEINLLQSGCGSLLDELYHNLIEVVNWLQEHKKQIEKCPFRECDVFQCVYFHTCREIYDYWKRIKLQEETDKLILEYKEKLEADCIKDTIFYKNKYRVIGYLTAHYSKLPDEISGVIRDYCCRSELDIDICDKAYLLRKTDREYTLVSSTQQYTTILCKKCNTANLTFRNSVIVWWNDPTIQKLFNVDIVCAVLHKRCAIILGYIGGTLRCDKPKTAVGRYYICKYDKLISTLDETKC